MAKVVLLMFALIIIAVSCFAIHPSDAQALSWVEKSPMPTPRYMFGVVTVNGTIYAIGGLTAVQDKYHNNRTGTTNTNEAYNPDTDTWVKKTPMPGPNWLNSFGIAAIQDIIYCIGGPANNIYDSALDSWSAKTPMPTPRWFLTANAVDGEIYLIGGRTMTKDNSPQALPGQLSYMISGENQAYDPSADSWKELAPMPYPVASYASAAVDNKIYVFSGVMQNGDITNIVQVYDTLTDNWTAASPIPNPVENAAAAALTSSNTSSIYVLGGDTQKQRYGTQSGTDFNQIYFPQNDSWTMGTPMIDNRNALAVTAVGYTLYAIGGYTDDSSFYCSNTWQYEPIEVASLNQTPASSSQTAQTAETIDSTMTSTSVIVTATTLGVVAGAAILVVRHKNPRKKLMPNNESKRTRMVQTCFVDWQNES